ncbi:MULTISPECIES: 5-formyltetrahydrofolate cyclo-ligase [Deefgea]|uniref:5-formyltetrahydrofolate cyclo-ligase n=1 Tax=Deefgea chitinilytica TaxID=570276 RepID=A0ABS2CFG5_9NEIS|nr:MULTISPECIES: 5-formyltetrahydrofolate cyclo-ligase [Deefgea]MBM5572876.1 5-formyltetrahydrofolate cyclo-ligase [Deefgea chitinilytica]MBM9890113.1 5-formyltetrahydrofolate cyclo-ligase [Deefgea sp. CFH1-16]
MITQKSQLRRQLRQIRAAISIADRQSAAWAVTHCPQILQKLRRGKKIALYVAVGSEFSAWPLIFLALRRGCLVYLPVVPAVGRKMSFVRLNQDSVWQIGAYNIPIPFHTEHCQARNLDVVFVPLLGFDQSLARLGQGGGFYDTTFTFRRNRQSWKKPCLIGLAFESQRVGALPSEPWDLRLDAIATELAYYRPV